MPTEIEYDRRSGQYRGPDGRYIGRSRIDALIQNDLAQVQASMRDLTSKLIEDSIDLGTWQQSMADLIKDSHLRMGLLASGGINAVSSVEYGAIGYEIKKQYQYLEIFSSSIRNGELSIEQVLARVNQYARSGRATFYNLEVRTRKENGFKKGKRLLDAQANHCSKCIAHQRTTWVDLSDIIAPGTNCYCRVNCRCRLEYARF